jgi:predicted RNA methylase
MTTQGEISGGGKVKYNNRKRDGRFYSEEQPYEKDADQWFIEPWWSVELLLDAEIARRPFGLIGDPCCGSGTIVRRCRARGLDAVGSDIRDRGFGFPVHDFLEEEGQLWARDWRSSVVKAPVTEIIMNPPYGAVARKIIDRARKLVPGRVCALVQAKFLYSEVRHAWFDHMARPSRIYHLSSRPSMPPGSAYLKGEISAEGGKMDFCWLVYDPEQQDGQTRTYWLKHPLPAQRRKHEPK